MKTPVKRLSPPVRLSSVEFTECDLPEENPKVPPIHFCAALALFVLTIGPIWGGPPLCEEGDRKEKVIADLRAALSAEDTPTGKTTVLRWVYKAESNPGVRRVIFEHIPPQTSAAIDGLLADVLTGDADAGIRTMAAKAFGTKGTDQCLPAMAKSAATDKVTEVRMGCIIGKGTARRAATFAIADLAVRYPMLKDKALTELRELKPPVDPNDTESLADARDQALYQVTGDVKPLSPFLERLRSKDAKVRESGAVAFRCFKLKVAPAELAKALGDDNASVRSWAAMALGEIADPKAVPALIAVANVTKQDAGLRCNAIGGLGQMKAVGATEQIRKLLADDSEVVQVQAAIALFRLTGEKVKQFPSGFNAD